MASVLKAIRAKCLDQLLLPTNRDHKMHRHRMRFVAIPVGQGSFTRQGRRLCKTARLCVRFDERRPWWRVMNDRPEILGSVVICDERQRDLGEVFELANGQYEAKLMNEKTIGTFATEAMAEQALRALANRQSW